MLSSTTVEKLLTLREDRKKIYGRLNRVDQKIAKLEKIPVCIIADSWKYSSKKIQIEQRNLNEIWNKAPNGIKIKNPAFEFVPKRYISKIISELGTLNYDDFLKKIKLQ